MDSTTCTSDFSISFILISIFNCQHRARDKGWAVVAPIVCEYEEKVDMATNLRAGFQERQHKHLSESIVVNLAPSKRAYPKPIYQELVSAPTPMPMSSTTAAYTIPELDERLPSTEGITYHDPRRPSIGPDHLSDESLEYMTFFPSHPKSSYVPSREEITELMR